LSLEQEQIKTKVKYCKVTDL